MFSFLFYFFNNFFFLNKKSFSSDSKLCFQMYWGGGTFSKIFIYMWTRAETWWCESGRFLGRTKSRSVRSTFWHFLCMPWTRVMLTGNTFMALKHRTRDTDCRRPSHQWRLAPKLATETRGESVRVTESILNSTPRANLPSATALSPELAASQRL